MPCELPLPPLLTYSLPPTPLLALLPFIQYFIFSESVNVNGLTNNYLLLTTVAQTTYHSRVTDRTESRPFSGSIMGPAGSDVMLIQLVKAAFEHAEWRSQVDAGRLAFPEDSNAE